MLLAQSFHSQSCVHSSYIHNLRSAHLAQVRLNSSALLSTEADAVNLLEKDEIIDKFARAKDAWQKHFLTIRATALHFVVFDKWLT
jgi:hypothetical protein